MHVSFVPEALTSAGNENKCDTSSETSFWHGIIQYQRHRLDQNVTEFIQAAEKGVHGTQTPLIPKILLSLKEVCAQVHKSSIFDTIFAEKAINEAYRLRQLARSDQDLRNFLAVETLAKLKVAIFSMSRLKIAFDTFLLAARLLPNLGYLRIVRIPAEAVARSPSANTDFDFDQALGLLGESSATLMRQLARRKKKKQAHIAERFNTLRNERKELHAEMRMLLYLTNTGILPNVFPYLGASKYCCVMCWKYLQCHGKFQARASHWHLWHRWLDPTSVLDLPFGTYNKLLPAHDAVRSWMISTLTENDPIRQRHAICPESSLGTETFIEKTKAAILVRQERLTAHKAASLELASKREAGPLSRTIK